MKNIEFVKTLKGKDYKVNIEIDEKQKIWDSIYCTTYMEGQKFEKCTIRSTRDGVMVRFKKVTDVDCIGQESIGLIVHESGAREELEEIIRKMRTIKEYQDQYVLDEDEKAILDAETIEFGYDPYELKTNLVSTPVVAYIKKYFESHDHIDFKLDRYDLTARVGRNEDLRAHTIKNGKPSGFYTVADIPADLFEKVVIFELERFLKEIEDEKKAEEEEDRKLEEKIKALAKKAKETGKKQVYSHYFVECTDDEEDCDLDLVEILVDEDGKTSKRITHTY
ncbi:MAG: hypothetical protein PUG84_03875 [Peptoniphilaceae bacterium]|nr:hypothetical protein [Peptoniphilaceae bacterium]